MRGGETPEELNTWAESLDAREVVYLLEQARRDLSTEQASFSALDARAVAIVGWAILGIGTLLVAGDIQFDLSGRGIAAGIVVIGSSIVVIAGIYALWPRAWASGLDLDWYRQFEWVDLKQMQARGLASLIHGSKLNREAIDRRNMALQLAAAGLILEFVALVATLLQ